MGTGLRFLRIVDTAADLPAVMVKGQRIHVLGFEPSIIDLSRLPSHHALSHRSVVAEIMSLNHGMREPNLGCISSGLRTAADGCGVKAEIDSGKLDFETPIIPLYPCGMGKTNFSNCSICTRRSYGAPT